ncbi:hypothetical protein [Nocardiopsis lucentensis]|uniref:hypothetical protein n=1 Tax=Nocardiopsis lucentensis TaxID=53441 RepID=UPI00034551C3|nr:hypothetical protein [Nocardiopsis lucentensis]
MPRIRTIKPEYWSSPGIENISPWSRLLFIAMWNWADDAGRGTCQLKELQAFAFPYDEDDTAPEVATMAGFKQTLAQVREQYDVVFYKVGGRPYYAIPSWRKHQRNERTAQSKHPAPEEGEKWDFLPSDQRSSGTSDMFRPTVTEGVSAPSEDVPDPRSTLEDEEAHDSGASGVIPLFGDHNTSPDLGSSGTSDNVRHGAAEAPQTSGPGTGEQGNRGTGETTSRSAQVSDPELDAKFEKFYATFPRKKDPRKARAAYIAAIKRGATPEQLLAGAERYAAEREGQPARYTKHPTSWLNADAYLDEPDVPQQAAASGGYQPYRNPTDQSVYDEGLL